MRAETVANTILEYAHAKDVEIVHLTLQKLMYFFHGEHLAKFGMPLLDEPFVAGKYGPIQSKIYNFYREFGGNPLGQTFYPSTEIATGIKRVFIIDRTNHALWDLLAVVWVKYGSLSPAQLSTLAHAPGAPWHQSKYIDSVISNDAIRDWFITENQTPTRYY